MIIMQNYKIFLTCIVGCRTFFLKRGNLRKKLQEMRNYRRSARSSSMILACAAPSPLTASGKTGAGKHATL